jgi:fused signal recognition particle receptor
MTSLWRRVADSIRKTRGVFAEGLQQVFTRGVALDEAFYEALEEVLLRADVGPETTQVVVARLKELARQRAVAEPAAARGLMVEVLSEILTKGWTAEEPPARNEGEPLVLLIVGVNGAGKTTSIGKLAWHYRQRGLHPLVVASDTFRAAALEQLGIWAERSGADIIRSQSGADAAAVAYDGVRAARARGAGVVLIDTAGRLQTNVNLMDELRKIRRVVAKAQPGSPHETLLVLDATVGQNALSQVRLFSEAAGVTGIFLAKLDGSAKGGVILAIAERLGVPVRYVGLGEELEAIAEFSPEDFARALLEPVGVGD